MYNTVNDLLTAIANAIRTKTGKSEKIATQDMPTEIENIQTGGGSEEWIPITDWTNIFYQASLIDNADKIIPHLDTSPTGMVNFSYLKNSIKYEIAYDLLKLLETTDFSKITNAQYAFNGMVIPKKDENVWEINCNIDFSKNTNMSYFLQRINYPNRHGVDEYAQIQKINLILDFEGTTNRVTNFSNAFSYLLINTMPILDILNLNMSACTNCTGMLNTLTDQSNLNRFTFSGSFGGSSSSSSLTLDLSKQNSLTVEAFLETMATISENTNGKTRIFKLPTELYDSLTDEIFDLADEKGYTLSS